MEASSRLEVSRGALSHNLGVLRALLPPGVMLAPVVKADAYGHSMVLCARIFAELGAERLCVNELQEVAPIVEFGVPVIVLGPTFVDQAADVATLECEVVVSTRAQVDALAAAGRAKGAPVGVHVKFETGTHRLGAPPSVARALVAHVGESDGVRLAGLSTHLADVEDETEHTFARVQLDRFEAAVEGIEATRHSAASAAVLLLARSRLDMVRPGIACYGLWPSRETRISADIVHGAGALLLQPAMTWKTRIASLSDCEVGEYVGYGRTLRLSRPSRVAVLPVGYWDGYVRALSGRGEVLVRGRRAPVAGRVCMNMTMVDVTGIEDVTVGDEVVLLGAQGEDSITAEELADRSSTIAYEVTTRIHPRLPRHEVA